MTLLAAGVVPVPVAVNCCCCGCCYSVGDSSCFPRGDELLRFPISLIANFHPFLVCAHILGRGRSMDCRKGRRAFTSATAMALLCCSLIAIFSISSLWSSARADLGNPTLTPRVQGPAGRRRGLSGSGSGCGSRGPGSYPPLCAAKCGECTPCNPVHEAVRPGQPAVEEYYPEAWRCKCGNKLYMP